MSTDEPTEECVKAADDCMALYNRYIHSHKEQRDIFAKVIYRKVAEPLQNRITNLENTPSDSHQQTGKGIQR